MKRFTRLLALQTVVILLAPLSFRFTVSAESPTLIFSEIKVRNVTQGSSGFDEFIELYNSGKDPIVLNDYFIGYVNTPTPTVNQSFNKSVIAEGLLAGGESFVLAKNDVDLNLPYAKKSPFDSLSDGGGMLRITDRQDVIIDQFAWTSSANVVTPAIQLICSTSSAACNANRSQSFGRGKNLDKTYVLSEPTWQLGIPTPHSAQLLPTPVPEPEPEPTSTPQPTPAPVPTAPLDPVPTPTAIPIDSTPAVGVVSPDPPSPNIVNPALPLQISELLPNPAPPASDSTDEYIELYNPNDQSVDLVGYKLQTGNTFSYSHVFTTTSLGAREYKSFTVTETGTILSNSGGQARLLDASGAVVAQTNTYDTANDGDAWALINGAWQWTTTPTPNAANELALPVLKVATTKLPTTTKPPLAAKKAAIPKATTAKTASVKAPAKVAAAKITKKAAAPERQVYQDPAQVPPSLHPGILVGVGVITLLYAAYEYRHDAANALKRFKRYRSLRRATRPQS